MTLSDNLEGARKLKEIVSQVGLPELVARLSAEKATDADLERLIAFMSEQITDYDPDEPSIEGFALTREVPSKYAEILEKSKAALEEAQNARQARGELSAAEQRTFELRQELLRVLEQYTRLWPYIIVSRLVDVLPELDITPDNAGIAEALENLKSMDMFDRREADHFLLLLTTADPLGIFLRGFVLIEAALNDCFREFLARPINLYKELDLYISGKIKLGYALGFLSDQEKAFLSGLNAERNKLVHEKESAARVLRHVFDAARERQLWARFIAVPSMARNWPAYDESKFPTNLKVMLITVWFLLNHRSNQLKKLRLAPLDESLKQNKVERQLLGAFAGLAVKAGPKIAAALADESGRERTAEA
jgi:hypothetical protein